MRRFARRVGCRFVERLGQFLVGVAHLDPRDDRFALLRLQPRERLLVALNGLTANGLFERRLSAVHLDIIKIGRRGPPALPPQLLPDAIEDRLAQIGLERTDTSWFELLDPLKRLKQGLLDKVLGVGDIARPPWQSAARPALEGLAMPREEMFERLPCRRPARGQSA